MKNKERTERKDTMNETSGLLKVKAVAEKLGLAVPTIYQFAQRGLLPCVKLGRAVRFRPESLERFLDIREKELYGKAA